MIHKTSFFFCLAPVFKVEIKQIILKTASGKTPGLDGWCYIECYKTFTELLVPKTMSIV